MSKDQLIQTHSERSVKTLYVDRAAELARVTILILGGTAAMFCLLFPILGPPAILVLVGALKYTIPFLERLLTLGR